MKHLVLKLNHSFAKNCVCSLRKNLNIFDFPHSLRALILTLMVYCKLACGVLSLTDSHRLTHKRRMTSHSVRGVKFIYFFSLQQQGKTSLYYHVQKRQIVLFLVLNTGGCEKIH